MEQAPTEDGMRWRDGMVLDRKYALVRQLGQGGVGAVFEAQNTWTGRRVAIKVLHPHYSRTEAAARRFLREAQNATQFSHPNIVDVLDLGQDPNEGSLFIVQEFLEGIDLRRWLNKRRLATPAEAIGVVLPVMEALGVMHAKKVVHRDVKPENIFLARTRDGIVPKVIDFGLSKALQRPTGDEGTRAGTLLGTPEYMSPEQAVGDTTMDERTDVWSIAIVLFELLCGRPPIASGSTTKIISRILTEPPPRIEKFAPNIDADLATIVHTGLAPDRDERFASMAAIAQALRGYAEQHGIDHFPALEIDDALSSDENAVHSTRSRLESPSKDFAGRETVAVDVHDAARAERAAAAAESDDSTRVTGIRDDSERRTISITALTGTPNDPPSAPTNVPPAVADRAEPTAATPEPMAKSTGRAVRNSLPPSTIDSLVRPAEQALEMNALEEAIERSLRAIPEVKNDVDASGRLLIVKASALNWRGSTAAAEQEAARAMSILPKHSDRWYQAAGELATSCGRRGRREQLTELVDELTAAPQENTPSSVIASCRLVTQLLEADWPELAESLLTRMQVDPAIFRVSAVRAWVNRVRAAMALYAGDPSAYLRLAESAADSFADAADAREACLQRAHVGDAFRMLGAYHDAERVLQHALAAAEPMKLWVAHLVRLHLGVVKATLGAEDVGLELLRSASEFFVARGDTRMIALSWIGTAQILAARMQLGEADELARAAVDLLASAPALRAFALAATARIALQQRRNEDALEYADAATKLLDYVRRNDEGEAMVRLVHAEALQATGDEDAACLAIMKARRRLRERAKRIGEESLRESYLEMPEHARTLQLAVEWLGG